MASKRKSLCINEKAFLIRAIEAGEKISDVGRRFGLNPSTVSTIWKNKEKILQAEEDGKSSKKLKKPKYEDLDQVMISWFHRQRQNNIPLSGPIVKAKAEKFAKDLGLTAFKASEGWLGKFKQRHHIKYGKISGEARIVDTNVTHDWINTIKIKEEQQEDEKHDSDDLEPPPSTKQALEAAKLLEKYFLYNQVYPTVSHDMNKILKEIQLKYWSERRQTKIEDYTQ